MSRQPGGSTEQTGSARKSARAGSASSAAPTAQGSAGTHAWTAAEKGAVATSCSARMTCGMVVG